MTTRDLLHRQSAGTDCGRIAHWLKRAGDWVTEGEALLEIEVDKTEVVVDSPFTGTLIEIGADVGDEVFDGDLLAVFQVPE